MAALDGIDLEIPAGQFVSLVGASGCGKTTLLDILSGLLEMQAGDVLLKRTWRHVRLDVEWLGGSIGACALYPRA